MVEALAGRVVELEGEVKGEKLVTRHILDQLRQNTDILLELRRELTGLHQKIDKVGDAVAIQSAQLAALEPKLGGIVSDAMRAVLRQRSQD